MAYDDYYIDRLTMKGSCDADISGTYPTSDHANDAPGQPVGCKFLAPGEPATTARANRTRYQLAHNCDILKGPLDAMLAVGRVAALNSFGPASSITINPLATGGSDVEFSTAGYLYVGNATDYSNNQESRDTLFQLLDEDYNEVLVGGAEVKVTDVSPAGAQPGNGFYNAGVVTLTLSDTIPSGNYRLVYARDTTLATFPDDALIRSEIRGIQEAAGEVGLKGAYILDPSSAPARPADFIGPTCLQDALTALGGDCTLFLRSGTYAVGALNVSQDQVRMVGEAFDSVILQPGSGNDFTVSGDSVTLEKLQVDIASGQKMSITNTIQQRAQLIDLLITGDLEIGVGGSVQYLLMDRVRVLSGNGVGAVYMEDTYSSTFRDCMFVCDTAATSPALEMNHVERLSFVNCRFDGGTTRTAYIHETGGGVGQVSFTDCRFGGAQGAANATLEVVLSGSGPGRIAFDCCKFYSSKALNTGDTIPVADLTIPSGHSISFRDCFFSTSNRALFDSNSVLGQLILDNCEFAQTRNGTFTISGAPLFYALAGTNVGEISVRNLTIRAQLWDGSAIAAVVLGAVRGSNVKIDFTGFGGGGIVSTDEMVYMSRCFIDQVVVDFANIAPRASAGGSDAAVKIVYESLITDLYIKGLDGDWGFAAGDLPVVHIEGGYGAGAGYVQAVVDGMRLENETTWQPVPVGCIRIEQYGTLRHLEVAQQRWDVGTYTSFITLGLATSPTRAKLLDALITLGESVFNPILYNVVAVYNDGDHWEICDNKFVIYPYEESGGPPPVIWPRRIICAGLSASPLTWPDPDPLYGQKFGRICNNHINWKPDAAYDLDPSLSPNGALIFLTDDAWFCTVHDNFFMVEGSIPNGNYCIWIENTAALFGGATSDNEPNACAGHSCIGNKAWAVDAVFGAQGFCTYSTGLPVGPNTTTHDSMGIAVCNTV